MIALIFSLLLAAQEPVTIHSRLLDAPARGGTFRLAVEIGLTDPWHIQANPAALPELIPTVLKMESTDAVQFDGILYPKGKQETVTWAETPVALYAGTQTVVATGTVSEKAPLGPVTFKGTLRYQACDDQVCYAPKTVPVTIETEIAESGVGRVTSRGAASVTRPTRLRIPSPISSRIAAFRLHCCSSSSADSRSTSRRACIR